MNGPIIPTADTSLVEFFENSYLPDRPLKKLAGENYRRSIKRLSKSLGHEATLADLAAPYPTVMSDGYHPALNALRSYAIELKIIGDPAELDLRPTAAQHPVLKSHDKPGPETPLMEFLFLDYMQANHFTSNRQPSRSTAATMAVIVRRFGKIMGHTPRVSDLTAENFDRLLDWLKTHGYQGKTQQSMGGNLLAIWRFAADLGIATIPDKFKRGALSKYRDPSDSTKVFQLEEGEGSLWGLCKTFFRLRVKIRDEKTRSYYEFAIKSLGVHLGRQPLVADLNDDTVTEWLIATIEASKSISTARVRIGRVLTLWRWAAQRRIVEQWPTVEQPPAPDPDPVALTVEELERLFKSAGEERGRICGIRARDWWRAWLAFVLHTAERYGAARQLRWEWVNLTTGVVKIPANVRKGHRKHAVYHLEPEVVVLLKKIQSPKRELVFPWHRCDGTYYNVYGRILERVGLPNDKKHKTHGLRATHATLKEILGGDACRSLGHGTRATTDRHYIDKSQLPPDPVKLPNPWLPAVELAPSPAETPTSFANASVTDTEALGWL